MARRVKCRVTGEYGTSDTFVKIDGKYYKSEAIYNAHQKNNEYRKHVIQKFCEDYLNYEEGQPFPTFLTKKLSEVDFYPWEVVYETMVQNNNNILYAINHKKFKTETHKISYLMAIIKNNIGDVYKHWQEQTEEESETKVDELRADEDEDIERMNNIEQGKSNKTDISRFL